MQFEIKIYFNMNQNVRSKRGAAKLRKSKTEFCQSMTLNSALEAVVFICWQTYISDKKLFEKNSDWKK